MHYSQTEKRLNMTKALIVTPDRWNMLLSIAQEMYESRAFGVTRGEAATKLLFCLEYGLPLSAANQGLYVVNGRVAAMGQIAAAELRKHPDYDYTIERLDDKGCTIAVSRHGEVIGTASFTEEDARRAELIDKDNYRHFPSDMYFNRAIGRAMRRFAPDALSMTVYTPEELGAEVDRDSEITLGEGTVWTVKKTEATEPLPTPSQEKALDAQIESTIDYQSSQTTTSSYDSIHALLAVPGWTAERIIAANEDKIPATAEECQKVAEKLGAEDAS